MGLLALGSADTKIVDTAGSLTDYFGTNIAVAVGAFVAMAMAVWMLQLLFRSVGVRRPRSGVE